MRPKHPWEMSRMEWNEAKDQLRPNQQGTGGDSVGSTRAASLAGILSHVKVIAEEREWLYYGLTPTYTVYSETGAPMIVSEKPKVTMGKLLDDWTENNVSHRDVVEKALRDGMNVPPKALLDYTDL